MFVFTDTSSQDCAPLLANCDVACMWTNNHGCVMCNGDCDGKTDDVIVRNSLKLNANISSINLYLLSKTNTYLHKS